MHQRDETPSHPDPPTMKKLLLTPAALIAFAAPIPAQASYTRTVYTETDMRNATKILDKLQAVGVAIVAPAMCPKNLAGKYVYTTATLTLCPLAYKDVDLMIETITHEAVHAAQHCVNAPLVITVPKHRVNQYSSDIVSAIGNKLTHVHNATKGLNIERRALEYEAYAFESRPELVLDILGKVCR